MNCCVSRVDGGWVLPCELWIVSALELIWIQSLRLKLRKKVDLLQQRSCLCEHVSLFGLRDTFPQFFQYTSLNVIMLSRRTYLNLICSVAFWQLFNKRIWSCMTIMMTTSAQTNLYCFRSDRVISYTPRCCRMNETVAWRRLPAVAYSACPQTTSCRLYAIPQQTNFQRRLSFFTNQK